MDMLPWRQQSPGETRRMNTMKDGFYDGTELVVNYITELKTKKAVEMQDLDKEISSKEEYIASLEKTVQRLQSEIQSLRVKRQAIEKQRYDLDKISEKIKEYGL